MKSVTASPLLFISLCVTFSLSPRASAVTLEEAYRSALQTNETVLIENAQAEQTEARVSQARSAMLPNITGTASMVHRSNATAINGQTARTNDQTTARIALVQPLFAGGRFKAALDQTNLLNDAQRKSVDASKATLYLTVAQAYYEVLAAEADLKNLQTSVELTEGRVKELQRRAKIGRSRSGEVSTGQSTLE
ncbi:MAG: TolC family protein, partial [Bdellovibrionota bacterium]